jgi:hypothetical protein
MKHIGSTKHGEFAIGKRTADRFPATIAPRLLNRECVPADVGHNRAFFRALLKNR